MNSIKDRTSEFKSCVENRSRQNDSLRQPLLASTNAGKPAGVRSQFATMAAKIGKDIQGTTIKLEKLAQRELTNLSPVYAMC